MPFKLILKPMSLWLFSHSKVFISLCCFSSIERNTEIFFFSRRKSIRQFKYKVNKPSILKKVITSLSADDGATYKGML